MMETNKEPTAAEISSLWTSYQNDTLTICGLRYFLRHVDDEEIRSTLEHALAISEEHVKKLIAIFNNENYPVPQSFTNHDVHLDAPRTRQIAEIAKYSNEGAKIMIEQGWMEQPPMATDRKNLAKI